MVEQGRIRYEIEIIWFQFNQISEMNKIILEGSFLRRFLIVLAVLIGTKL